MDSIESDVQGIINEKIDNHALKEFVIDVVEWEDEKLHKKQRQGKYDKLSQSLKDAMQDW